MEAQPFLCRSVSIYISRSRQDLLSTVARVSGDPLYWSTRSLDERLAWVARFRAGLAANERELCKLMQKEVGKPRFEGLTSDVACLLAACKWVEQNARQILSPRRLSGGPWWMPGVKVTEERRALGTVAIIATWNYPVQLLGTQLMHALAAGNHVIVKPSESAPRTQMRLIEIALQALPESAGNRGVITYTNATRHDGPLLLQHGVFDHVIFTGSTEVGREIANLLAPTLTPATLELSGRDSVFVLASADTKLAAQSVWAAMCMNNGQTCMGPRRVFVESPAYEKFVKHLEKIAATTTAKPGSTRRLIDAPAARKCFELASRAVAMGGRAVPGGAVPVAEGAEWRPTAVVDCPRDASLLHGRHFGPATAVLRVESVDDALTLHRGCDQHLATSIYSKDRAAAESLAARLNSTTITINDTIVPTGHPAVAIGGHGASGMGVSRGGEGLLGLTRPVYITRSKGAARRLLQVPPAPIVERVAGFLRWWYGAGDWKPRSLMAGEFAGGPVSVPTARIEDRIDAPTGLGAAQPNSSESPGPAKARVVDPLLSGTPPTGPDTLQPPEPNTGGMDGEGTSVESSKQVGSSKIVHSVQGITPVRRETLP